MQVYSVGSVFSGVTPREMFKGRGLLAGKRHSQDSVSLLEDLPWKGE